MYDISDQIMKKSYSLALFLVMFLGIVTIFLGINTVMAEEDKIPSWVKKNMMFWGDGLLEDFEMVEMLQYLINHNIIQLETTVKTIEKPELVCEVSIPVSTDSLDREIASLITSLEYCEDTKEDDIDVIKESYEKDFQAYFKQIKELEKKVKENYYVVLEFNSQIQNLDLEISRLQQELKYLQPRQ